jgi:hypothetical protein
VALLLQQRSNISRKKAPICFEARKKGKRSQVGFSAAQQPGRMWDNKVCKLFFFKCLFLLNYKATLKAKIEYSMWRTGQGCQMLHIFSNQKSQFG